MPKSGQRQNDGPGRNNPAKSQDMTTGSEKTAETYRKQAVQHEDPGKAPPVTKAPHAGPHEGYTLEQVSRLRMQEPEARSGSVTWNRLTGVTDPARLDEAANGGG